MSMSLGKRRCPAMKVEYVTSTLGVGTELHISSAEYKRIHSEDGFSDNPNLMFAVRSYVKTNLSTNTIIGRDLEEAFRHIKKSGNIVLATKTDGVNAWCEIYAVTEGEIIPVKTSKDGNHFQINYSAKTKLEMKRLQQKREEFTNE